MSLVKQRAANCRNPKNSIGPSVAENHSPFRFGPVKHGIRAGLQIMFEETAGDLAEFDAELSILSFTTSGVSAACAASKPFSGTRSRPVRPRGDRAKFLRSHPNPD
jgi:hypothetical protein